MWYRKLRNSVTSLGKDESGANAVEFALVILVMIPLILAILEFGIILFNYNNMVQAARETARVLAVQEATLLQAEAVVKRQLAFKGQGAGGLSFGWLLCAPQATLPNCSESDAVSVTITVPLAEVSLINFQGFFSTGNPELEATVTMQKE